jgi:hypothetical protein
LPPSCCHVWAVSYCQHFARPLKARMDPDAPSASDTCIVRLGDRYIVWAGCCLRFCEQDAQREHTLKRFFECQRTYNSISCAVNSAANSATVWGCVRATRLRGVVSPSNTTTAARRTRLASTFFLLVSAATLSSVNLVTACVWLPRRMRC